MTDNSILIICPSFQVANALRGFYATTPNVKITGDSPTGSRADRVVVLPMTDEASETEREAYARATREHFCNRVNIGGEFIVI